MWASPLEAKPGKTVDLPLLRAAKILNDYIDSGSSVKRMFFGHWNRQHVIAATNLVHQIQNGEIANIEDLMTQLLSILIDPDEKLNSNGSYFKRVGFIATKLLDQPLAQLYCLNQKMNKTGFDEADHAKLSGPQFRVF